MSTIISSSELKLKSNDSINKLIFFGSGYIADKTIERTQVYPFKIVDNNRDLQGLKLKNIEIISIEKSLEYKAIYIITSTSIQQIENQLMELGIKEEQIFISPMLKEHAYIQKFESNQFDFIFSSGLQDQTPKDQIGGGGVYRVKGEFDNFEIKKILQGPSHGIKKINDKYYVVNEKYGIAKLDKDLNFKSQYNLDAKRRAHGLDYCEELNVWVAACSYGDSILVFDDLFNIKKEIKFSKLIDEFSGQPQHHTNDLCVVNNKAYVSMFSLSGQWKRGYFDGGVLVIDLISCKVIDKLYGNLKMPHSISYEESKFWILDSLNKSVYCGDELIISNLLSFTRGLDFTKEGNLLIGQSKNRNFSSLKSNPYSPTSLDTAITFVSLDPLISKNISLPSSISEIHAIQDIS